MRTFILTLFFLALLVFGCSKNSAESSLVIDSKAGKDLFTQLSENEKKLLGKWYFAYRTDEHFDGTIDIFYDGSTGLVDPNQTDTLMFYSKEFVGQHPQFGCLENNPPLLKGKLIKLIEPRSARWFGYCFPFGYGGWLIDRDTLVYYRGYNIDDILKYHIVELNSDSLVFNYEKSTLLENSTATFYKN
jgi:hypothetical protein